MGLGWMKDDETGFLCKCRSRLVNKYQLSKSFQCSGHVKNPVLIIHLCLGMVASCVRSLGPGAADRSRPPRPRSGAAFGFTADDTAPSPASPRRSTRRSMVAAGYVTVDSKVRRRHGGS